MWCPKDMCLMCHISDYIQLWGWLRKICGGVDMWDSDGRCGVPGWLVTLSLSFTSPSAPRMQGYTAVQIITLLHQPVCTKDARLHCSANYHPTSPPACVHCALPSPRMHSMMQCSAILLYNWMQCMLYAIHCKIHCNTSKGYNTVQCNTLSLASPRIHCDR